MNIAEEVTVLPSWSLDQFLDLICIILLSICGTLTFFFAVMTTRMVIIGHDAVNSVLTTEDRIFTSIMAIFFYVIGGIVWFMTSVLYSFWKQDYQR